MMTLFILFVAVYAFFAGMVAEHEHTKMLADGKADVELPSLKIALLWPLYIWRNDK